MSDGLLELFVLGRLPGTEVYIDYVTSLIIGGSIFLMTSAYVSYSYYRRTARYLNQYTPEKLIDLKTI
jgi:hypothetical protein